MKVLHWFNPKTREGGQGEPLEDKVAKAHLERQQAKKDGLTYWLETPKPEPATVKTAD